MSFRSFVALVLVFTASGAAAADRCTFYGYAQETNVPGAATFQLTHLEGQPTCAVGPVTLFAALRADAGHKPADQLTATVPFRGWSLAVGKQLVPWGYATPPADKKEYVDFQPGSDETVYQTGIMLTRQRAKVDALRIGIFDRDGGGGAGDRSFMGRYQRTLASGITLAGNIRTSLSGARHDKAAFDATYAFGALRTTIGLADIWKERRTSENWLLFTYKMARVTPYALIQSHNHAREFGVAVDASPSFRVRIEHETSRALPGGRAWRVQLQQSVRFALF